MSDLIPMLAPWGGRVLAVVMLLLGAAVAGRALFGDRPRGRGRCPRCWYDAAGLPGPVCPECGHRVGDDRERLRTRRHWRGALLGAAVAVAVPAWAVQRRVSAYGWDYYTYVGPIRWVSPTRAVQSFAVGAFRVEVRRDRIPWEGEPTLRVSGPGGADYVRGLWRGSIRADAGGGPLLVDLNGNGFPEILAEQDAGGIHRNTTASLIELNPHIGPQLLAAIDVNAGPLTELRDVDGDGRAEVITRDWRFCYEFTTADAGASPEVVLAWRDGALRPAAELMRTPLPPASDRAAIAAEIRSALAAEAGAEPAQFRLRSAVLRLLYGGHPAEAWALLDAAWPPGRPGKAAFAAAFRAELKASPYASEVMAAGGSPTRSGR